MRRAGVVGAILCVLAVSGCSGPDLTAVPTEAAAPFVCAGVPRAGVELLLGGRGTVATDTGSWGGAVGAGVLGGLGLRGVLGGVRPTITVPGQTSMNAIGATGRAAGSGVLGRGGSGVPGQSVTRGGAAGRGGKGGRGGAVGGAGGRRRGKGKDDSGHAQYDADEDWTEDDGQYPGVID